MLQRFGEIHPTSDELWCIQNHIPSESTARCVCYWFELNLAVIKQYPWQRPRRNSGSTWQYAVTIFYFSFRNFFFPIRNLICFFQLRITYLQWKKKFFFQLELIGLALWSVTAVCVVLFLTWIAYCSLQCVFYDRRVLQFLWRRVVPIHNVSSMRFVESGSSTIAVRLNLSV